MGNAIKQSVSRLSVHEAISSVELYEGRLSPLTSEIGFLQCDVEAAVKAFPLWQKCMQGPRGVEVEVSRASCESLDILLENLLPLTSVERRRMLFVSTRGSWCAYFDNGWRGTDAYSTISYLAEMIGCRGGRMLYVPHSLDSQEGTQPGRYGAVALEIFSAQKTDFVNTERSIAVAFDGKKWAFSEAGAKQCFEQVDQYANRSVRSRFTEAMLEEYLMALGIDAFKEDFYDPENAFLAEKKGPMAPATKEFSLSEVQASW